MYLFLGKVTYCGTGAFPLPTGFVKLRGNTIPCLCKYANVAVNRTQNHVDQTLITRLYTGCITFYTLICYTCAGICDMYTTRRYMYKKGVFIHARVHPGVGVDLSL